MQIRPSILAMILLKRVLGGLIGSKKISPALSFPSSIIPYTLSPIKDLGVATVRIWTVLAAKHKHGGHETARILFIEVCSPRLKFYIVFTYRK